MVGSCEPGDNLEQLIPPPPPPPPNVQLHNPKDGLDRLGRSRLHLAHLALCLASMINKLNLCDMCPQAPVANSFKANFQKLGEHLEILQGAPLAALAAGAAFQGCNPAKG